MAFHCKEGPTSILRYSALLYALCRAEAATEPSFVKLLLSYIVNHPITLDVHT